MSQEKQFRVGPKTPLNFAELIPMKPRCSLPVAQDHHPFPKLTRGLSSPNVSRELNSGHVIEFE